MILAKPEDRCSHFQEVRKGGKHTANVTVFNKKWFLLGKGCLDSRLVEPEVNDFWTTVV